MKSIISTPIFYVNARPHIGHLYTLLYADSLKRTRWLLTGQTSYLTTGCDEHGLKVEQSARAKRLPPDTHCSQQSQHFLELCSLFDVQHDAFIRTSQERHKEVVGQVWLRLHQMGLLSKHSYQGWYDVGEEQFLAEQQFRALSLEQQKTYSLVEEDNYLLDMDVYRERVGEILLSGDLLNKPALGKQLRGDLKVLPHLSVSRSASRVGWGIPVPGDSSQTVYVWLDALCSYLTGEKSLGGEPLSAPGECFQQTHVIGKDILKFHGIYWLYLREALGLGVPEKIMIHDHWISGKKKMSKSKGNVVDPLDLLALFSRDQVRLYMLSEGPQDSDVAFQEKGLKKSSNQIGHKFLNQIGRLLSPKVFSGRIEEVTWRLSEVEHSFLSRWDSLAGKAGERMLRGDFKGGYQNTEELMVSVGKYLAQRQPWTQQGSDKDRSVFMVMEGSRIVTDLLRVFMPDLACRVSQFLDLPLDRPALLTARPIDLEHPGQFHFEPRPCFLALRMDRKDSLSFEVFK